MTDKKRVVITINGGIPEIVEAPDGVDVEIWDYDTDGMYQDDLDQLVTDSNGREYFLREG